MRVQNDCQEDELRTKNLQASEWSLKRSFSDLGVTLEGLSPSIDGIRRFKVTLQGARKGCTFLIMSGISFVKFFRLALVILFLIVPTQVFAQNSQFFTRQGQLHYELKEYDEAIYNFEQALQFQNPSQDLYVYLASSHLLNKNPKEALKSADEGLDKYPEFIRLKVMKGEALIQTDIEKAIPVFEEVGEAIRQSGSRDLDGIGLETVENYLARVVQQAAITAFQNEDFDRAVFHYRHARELNPDSLSVHNNLTYILTLQEKWEEADKAVDTGLVHFPNSENLLLMKAQVLEQSGKADDMTEILERLYKADPDNMNRAVLYGKSLLKANKAEKANLFFQDKINKYPEERILYEALLEMNRQRFNQTGVLEVLRLQKEQFPEDEEVLEDYGLELITAQRYEQASAYFDSLAVTYSNPGYGQIAARSWLYDEDLDRAEAEYRKQLERWPDHSLLMEDFGRVLKKNGKTKEAKEVFKSYLDRNESDMIRMEYAELLEASSEKEDVLKPLDKTLYESWAQWILLKDREDVLKDDEKRAYSKMLNGMIRLHENRQMLVKDEVQTGLETLRAPNPPIFQTSAEFEKISDDLQEFVTFLGDRLSFEAALETLQEGLAEYPESALLIHHKGHLHYQNRRFEQALEHFENAAKIQNNNEETHLYLGHIYNEFDQFEKSVLSYERVLTINPANHQAYRALIRLHQESGELEQLGSRWLQRYQHQKQNEILRDFLIDALHRADRFEEARALLE